MRFSEHRIVYGFRWILLVGAVFGVSAVFAAVWLPGMQSVEIERVAAAITAADVVAGAALVHGSPDAPALHVFGDYECPACRAFEAETRRTLDALVAAGRVRIVYHHATLRGHRYGTFAASVVACSGSDSWDVHTEIYRRAPDWKRAADPAAAILSIVAMRMDTVGMRRCLTATETASRLRAAQVTADKLGIHEVPSLVLYGERIRFSSYRAIRRYLEKRLTSGSSQRF